MLDSLPHGDFTRVLVTLWAIWHARRKAIHEQNFQSPHATNHFINTYLRELNESRVKKKPTGSSTASTHLRRRRIPPVAGCCKIHVDGATSRTSNDGSISAVRRDDMGKYLKEICPRGNNKVIIYYLIS